MLDKKKSTSKNLKKPLKTLTNKPSVTMINCSLKYKGFDEEEYVSMSPARESHPPAERDLRKRIQKVASELDA